jgi:hypothetical protein
MHVLACSSPRPALADPGKRFVIPAPLPRPHCEPSPTSVPKLCKTNTVQPLMHFHKHVSCVLIKETHSLAGAPPSAFSRTSSTQYTYQGLTQRADGRTPAMGDTAFQFLHRERDVRGLAPWPSFSSSQATRIRLAYRLEYLPRARSGTCRRDVLLAYRHGRPSLARVRRRSLSAAATTSPDGRRRCEIRES